ncbi:MAG TPA: Hsp20/alpha crystallin family protein [Candidatus Kapabacteria bacterium]|nr:Hsp20/alpha crystallin family protein [Candidatus Kapabacteria bacterium]
MSLIKYDPWRSFENMENQMQRFFNNFGSGWLPATTFEMDSYLPKVDSSEDDKNIYFSAELPGLTKDDVKITLSDGILTISGKKERKEEKKEKNYHRVERSFGEFTRQFELPKGYNQKQIEAKFNNGVLEVTIPKNEISKPKEEQVIPILSGEKGEDSRQHRLRLLPSFEEGDAVVWPCSDRKPPLKAGAILSKSFANTNFILLRQL